MPVAEEEYQAGCRSHLLMLFYGREMLFDWCTIIARVSTYRLVVKKLACAASREWLWQLRQL